MQRFRMLIVLVVLGALAYFGIKLAPLFLFANEAADSTHHDPIVIVVRNAHPPREISQDLNEKGAISDWTKFYRLGIILKRWRKMKTGEYEVRASMTPLEIFSVLESGVSRPRPVTIQEGQNMYQIADKFFDAGLDPDRHFLELVRDRDFIHSFGAWDSPLVSLEGYLFPDTYHFNRSLSLEEMVGKMVARFKEVWTDEYTERAKALKMTQNQIMTLASIIEKETGAPDERRLIGSVFHNRLKKHMRLQSDPTTIYGIWQSFNGNLTRAHLKMPTAYNTYAISGLPRGPIANPGREAIEAALNPDDTDFLYFVSKNEGHHVFSATLEEHNRAVRDFQINRTAREGKSWRDLKQ